jgi:hypothetical protein
MHEVIECAEAIPVEDAWQGLFGIAGDLGGRFDQTPVSAYVTEVDITESF